MAPLEMPYMLKPSQEDAISEVSGPVIFWALLAIVLNAMAQNSPTARRFRETITYSEGLLIPWLSSPIFCAADICADLYQIGRWILTAQNRTTPLTGDMISAGSTPPTQLVAVRIVLVIFGVLPQAVKLYGMSGIPWTKALASIYLIVTLVRLLRTSLCGNPSSQDTQKEQATQEEWRTWQFVSSLSLKIFLPLLHIAAHLWLWNNIAKEITLDRGGLVYQNLYDVLLLLGFAGNVFCLLVMLTGCVNSLFTVVPALHRYQFRSIYLPRTFFHWYLLIILPGEVMKLGQDSLQLMADPPKRESFPRTSAMLPAFLVRLAPILALALLSSWLIAQLVSLVSRIVLNFRRFVLQVDDINEGNHNMKFLEDLGLVFALLNLITAWIWYSIVWDGSGTEMPNWGGWLG